MFHLLHSLLLQFLFGTEQRDQLNGIDRRRVKNNQVILQFISLLSVLILVVLSMLAVSRGDGDSLTIRRENMPPYSIGILLSALCLVLGYILRKSTRLAPINTVLYLEVLSVYFVLGWLGTRSVPKATAVLFNVVLVAIPVLIDDVPWRLNLLSLFSVVFFLLASHAFKDPVYFQADLVNSLVTLVISVSVNVIVQSLRVADWLSDRRILHMSHHDELTGLCNRHALTANTEEALQTCHSVCVMMADLNGLKAANDSQGHRAGDRLIITTARGLVRVYGQEQVYRMGGDEFLAVHFDESPEEAEQKRQELQDSLARSGVSIATGIAWSNHRHKNLESLIRIADARMYEEKVRLKQGR